MPDSKHSMLKTSTKIPAEVFSEHPYVSRCEEAIANASRDPLFSASHLSDILTYLSYPSAQWPLGSYTADVPFAWSYTCSVTDGLQLSPNSKSKDFDLVGSARREQDDFELLFLSGHPSSGWLNTIGYKYNVDIHFFQQHLRSIRPSVYDLYAEPSLPSGSRHTLKLSIPTIGTLSNAKDLFGDISRTRSLLAEDLRSQFLERVRNPPVGRPVIRKAYLHTRKQFTLLQEVSMCLLPGNGVWTGTVPSIPVCVSC